MRHTLSLVLSLAFLLLCCAESATAKSLWKKTPRDKRLELFSEKEVTWKKHDMLTIKIIENVKAKHENETDLSKDSTFTSSILSFFKFNFGLKKPVATDTNPSWGYNSKKAFTGDGSSQRKANFVGTITAEVIDILPNGSLTVSATKTIRVNNDVQVLTLTGVVAQKNISAAHTVLSSSIADVNVAYTGRGPVDDMQKRGIVSKILDKIWIF